jgi:hypothetical protein
MALARCFEPSATLAERDRAIVERAERVEREYASNDESF